MTSAHPKRVRVVALLLAAVAASGCASLVSGAAEEFADNLSAAVLNQDDPETARAAIPSYMVLIDSLLEGNPDNPAMLAAAARLYASYGAVFAEDPERAARLTKRGRRYAARAMCLRYEPACGWQGQNFEEFTAGLAGVTARDDDFLYTYGFATLAYLRAHSEDWDTLAELPEMEALFDRYLSIAGDAAEPATHMYLGILLTLRPPALGGRPEEARGHFEKAIEMTDGRDLSVKVEFARGYAKLLYERELHDRLLGEVVNADPYADRLTLSNVLAQEDARTMLDEADDYF